MRNNQQTHRRPHRPPVERRRTGKEAMSVTTEQACKIADDLKYELEDPQAAADIRSLAAERDQYREILGNVLAVLNGDGGHRQADVGTEQAAKDGLARFFDACVRAEAAEAAKGVGDA
jgi:hypothetical protein